MTKRLLASALVPLLIMLAPGARSATPEHHPNCIDAVMMKRQLAFGGFVAPILELVSWDNRTLRIMVNPKTRHWVLVATDVQGCARIERGGFDFDGGLSPERVP